MTNAAGRCSVGLLVAAGEVTMAMEVRQLDAFGAEVLGIDARGISVWLDHGLLVIRGVEQDPDAQLGLARCFGPLQEHPVASVQVAGEPRLIFLGNEGDADYLPIHRVDGELRRGFLYWHSDLTYVPDINKGAMLGMRDIPAMGGDTEFADTAGAYDDLTEEMKARIDGLEAVHTARVTPERAWGFPGMSISLASRQQFAADDVPPSFPPVLHPLVITHGETGRKSLLLSPLSFVKIPGLPVEEGEALYEELVEHALQPRYRYRHRWAGGDMVLWDNRRTMHCAMGYPPGETRMAIRATLAERQTTGRLYAG